MKQTQSQVPSLDESNFLYKKYLSPIINNDNSMEVYGILSKLISMCVYFSMYSMYILFYNILKDTITIIRQGRQNNSKGIDRMVKAPYSILKCQKLGRGCTQNVAGTFVSHVAQSPSKN